MQRILWKIEGRATQRLQEKPQNSLQALLENDLRSLLITATAARGLVSGIDM